MASVGARAQPVFTENMLQIDILTDGLDILQRVWRDARVASVASCSTSLLVNSLKILMPQRRCRQAAQLGRHARSVF